MTATLPPSSLSQPPKIFRPEHPGSASRSAAAVVVALVLPPWVGRGVAAGRPPDPRLPQQIAQASRNLKAEQLKLSNERPRCKQSRARSGPRRPPPRTP